MRHIQRRPLVWISLLALANAAALVVLADGPARTGNRHIGVVRSALHEGIITVEAEDATVADVIEAIARVAGFEVRGDSPGKDVRITRTLEGTLDELLISLLRDGNYVL